MKRVKFYSINDCNYCNVLREVLIHFKIDYDEVKVLRGSETGEGMLFSDYLNLEKDIPIMTKCTFPQVYIDGKYIGTIKNALDYLQNENK
jgi:glutaredoxin